MKDYRSEHELKGLYVWFLGTSKAAAGHIRSETQLWREEKNILKKVIKREWYISEVGPVCVY